MGGGFPPHYFEEIDLASHIYDFGLVDENTSGYRINLIQASIYQGTVHGHVRIRPTAIKTNWTTITNNMPQIYGSYYGRIEYPILPLTGDIARAILFRIIGTKMEVSGGQDADYLFTFSYPINPFDVEKYITM